MIPPKKALQKNRDASLFQGALRYKPSWELQFQPHGKAQHLLQPCTGEGRGKRSKLLFVERRVIPSLWNHRTASDGVDLQGCSRCVQCVVSRAWRASSSRNSEFSLPFFPKMGKFCLFRYLSKSLGILQPGEFPFSQDKLSNLPLWLPH